MSENTLPTPSDPLERALDLAGNIERHPLGTVAAAVGAGYVLGGGLFTPLTERLVKAVLRVGLRFVVMPIVEREIIGAAQALFSEGGVPESAAAKTGGKNGADRVRVSASSA